MPNENSVKILPPPHPPVLAAPVTEGPDPEGAGPVHPARAGDAAAARLLFDDSPEGADPGAGDRVLLVGLVWGQETLIELEQVGRGGGLRAGKLFDLPEAKLPPEFRIVQPQGDGHVFTVPAGVHAEVHRAGGVRRFDQAGSRAVQAPFAGHARLLSARERVVVRIAPQLQLVARYVRAERQRDRSLLASLDVGFASTVAVALLFLALFWLMVRIAPRHDEVTDDLAGHQQRIARYQVKPREKPPEEQPKPREVSGVQEGAKARDEEGKLGKREAKKKEAAPSRKGAPVVDADKRESDRRKVMKLGLVAALSKMGATAGSASNVLGPGGLGTGINHALGGVKGRAGPGDAYGVGGLGSRGTGQGGGGTAMGIGGLGTKGAGGGRGGYGEVDLGGRGKEETQFIPGRTIVVGGLSRDVINRIIQRHYNEVKYCYEKELTKDPALYGKVTVLFVIDGVGRVGDALVQQSTMGSEPVESCIVTHVRRWAFPAPEGGGTVQVTYPYVFKSSAP
ncbi:MAG TPA: AgmX/PglI C-terminal domain-containing protein [Myxococcales bacterium]|nr:AgmX/PglI C-terminal domain-containing protein [Myxococcales bacterium]